MYTESEVFLDCSISQLHGSPCSEHATRTLCIEHAIKPVHKTLHERSLLKLKHAVGLLCSQCSFDSFRKKMVLLLNTETLTPPAHIYQITSSLDCFLLLHLGSNSQLRRQNYWLHMPNGLSSSFVSPKQKDKVTPRGCLLTSTGFPVCTHVHT